MSMNADEQERHSHPKAEQQLLCLLMLLSYAASFNHPKQRLCWRRQLHMRQLRMRGGPPAKLHMMEGVAGAFPAATAHRQAPCPEL